MNTDRPISRKANIVVQELDNEVLIYDLSINKAYCLNETAGVIWQLCDGTKTVADISRSVGKRFNSDDSAGLVWLALEQLKKDNLIDGDFGTPTEFAGMTRREIVRKVGLASLAALPIVASIVVPTPVNALSCILSQQNLPCTTSGQCCDNGLCVGAPMVCACICVNPGDCITQTSCLSTANCNPSGQCAP